ncbi:MAG: hypothetical protein QNM02_15765 [Acidimicrobiia bacterium]|nr:hypothetical protein [Acidimicrobiia bacterium]
MNVDEPAAGERVPAADRPEATMGARVPTMDEHWDELVTAALLGTDRRDPPAPIGPLADLVADTARIAPSERMLAHVAACTAIRRAGVLPASPAPGLAPPDADERPACPAAAVERWHHIVASWPVLEDEWLLTLIRAGWRAAPELAPAMLRRHRSDQRRLAVATAAIGPLASWLVEQLPEFAAPSTRGRRGRATAADLTETLGELPQLPIPVELHSLLAASGAESGGAVALGLERGTLGPAHRGVLVNLLARLRPDALGDLADVIDAVDPASSGYGLATVLTDLATTRRRMLSELAPSIAGD